MLDRVIHRSSKRQRARLGRILAVLLAAAMMGSATPISAGGAWYRVRRDWQQPASQIGAYLILDNAIAHARRREGYRVYDAGGRQIYPSVSAAEAAPTPAPQPESTSDTTTVRHTVRSGETLWALQQRYGIRWQAIAEANGIRSPYWLRVGQVLTLPGTTNQAPAPAPTPAPQPEVTTDTTAQRHTVRSGETLWALQQRYGIRWQAIAEVNGIRSPYWLHVGQVLTLPATTSQAPVSVPTPAPTPTPQPEVPDTSAAENTDGGRATVYGRITASELELYLGMVASEAGSRWDYEGCLMIAQVMVNRVISGLWGSDMRSVLSARGQFTPYETGAWRGRIPTSAQRQAALDALDGKMVFGRDVLYFTQRFNYDASAWWQSLPFVVSYDNTVFCARR